MNILPLRLKYIMIFHMFSTICEPIVKFKNFYKHIDVLYIAKE